MIEINNLTAGRIDAKFLKRIAGAVLKGEKKPKADLSVALIGEKRIKELNKKYRKKDKVTDVLSFGDNKGLKNPFLGEIVICPDQVRKDAKELNLKKEKEMALVLIHGILHLLGYDHEKPGKKAGEMRKKEITYLNKFFK